MAQTWIPVKYGLPKDPGYYIVYIHQQDHNDGHRIYDSVLDEHITGFVYTAYFNVSQGGIWQTDGHEVYGSDLNKVDTNNDYYISHWMPMPDEPEEGI